MRTKNTKKYNKKENDFMEKYSKFCSNANCEGKGKLLSLDDFYKGHNTCKKCHKKRVQENLEKEILRAIARLLQQKIIQSNEVTPARTLYLSCKSRIEACKYKKGIYKDVSCNWNNPVTMMKDIIIKLPSMWNQWKIQDVIYLGTKQLNDRATIDRIDETKGYAIDNIQCLSYFNNAKKASSKPCSALIIHHLRLLKVVEFSSLKEAMKGLQIPYATINLSIDSGEIQGIGNGYSILLQSEQGVIEKNGEAKYIMVLNHRREKYELETNKTVEVIFEHQYQMPVNSIGFRLNKHKKRPSEINSKG